MTIKYFDNRAIMIEYDRNTICITDAYNGFRFTMDTSMKEYFVPCIEGISKLCYLFEKGNIPTHKYVNEDTSFEILCNEILNCYRGNNRFSGNYMDLNRKNKIVSAFKECFKRVKEKDIELLDLNLKRFNLKSLLFLKKGLL